MKHLIRTRPRRTVRWMRAAGLLLGMVFPSAATADDVHLKNGQTFEDVVATETATGVRIRVAFGEITVARSAVDRIVRAESSVDRYLTRRAELQRSGASASEWIALAEWGLREDVEHGAREAAIAAARLDPEVDGLAPLMRSLGYTYSEQRGEWLSADDYMRSLGYIRSGGEWVSPEEVAERRRVAEAVAQAEQQARAEAREQRLAEAVELLTLAQLAEASQPLPPAPVGVAPIAVFAGYYPFHGPRPRIAQPPYAVMGPTAEDPPHALDILIRPPGSLFPIRSHRGSLDSIKRP